MKGNCRIGNLFVYSVNIMQHESREFVSFQIKDLKLLMNELKYCRKNFTI